jgi:hypothetical protein
MKKQRNNPKRQCNYQISNATLDVRHKHMIKTFDTTSQRLTKLTKEYTDLDQSLADLKAIPKKVIRDHEIKEIVIIRDKLAHLKGQIDDLQNHRWEIEYFTNTSDILYNYYDLVENNSDENVNMVSNLSVKSIAQYFSESNENTSTDTKHSSGTTSSLPAKKTDNGVPTSVVAKLKYNRARLLDAYLSKTDSNYINNNIYQEDTNLCSYCNMATKDILVNEGIICCRNCYTIEHIITDNEKPSYKDPPKEISYFSYKRINHFSEWLNQIQGKETTDIPEEVFDKIMLELNKQRIYNLVNVTTTKIREILKKHKINKYYEHIPYILNKITGIPNPHLNSELEEKLKNMFKEIQVPFLKYSPSNRKNFLSYSYVLHKFIQLLDEKEFLQYFPLLKSRDKLHQQEQIWKKICEELNWKFIRSI